MKKLSLIMLALIVNGYTQLEANVVRGLQFCCVNALELGIQKESEAPQHGEHNQEKESRPIVADRQQRHSPTLRREC